MTMQSVFDTVLAGIRKQGGPSIRNFDGCAYRSHDGTACAVGLLIPDELYDEKYEGELVSGVFEHSDTLAAYLTALIQPPGDEKQPGAVKFYAELQGAHDDPYFKSAAFMQNKGGDLDLANYMKEFEINMQAIAAHYRMVYTPPDMPALQIQTAQPAELVPA